MSLSPIIIFAYNRPEHTRKTLSALKQNHLADQSKLIIYVDGPKPDASEEQKQKIAKVREVIREEAWCKDVEIIESGVNKGLARSVTEGVTHTVEKYGKVIVLEDDLLPDVWFLKFMNDSLNMYEHDVDVACISGYIYPVKEPLPETFFLKGADCWGWATWKRGWDLFDSDGKALLQELKDKNLGYDFSIYNSYPYMEMLQDQIDKKNNSWAILWYASTYLKNKHILYPGKSLIQNIGVDGSGIHSAISTNFDVVFYGKEIPLKKIEVIEDTKAKKIIADYFTDIYKTPPLPFSRRFINCIKRILR